MSMSLPRLVLTMKTSGFMSPKVCALSKWRVSGSSGDSAWVNSEYRIRGQSSKGRPIDVLSTETILLRKTPQGWRVQHVHWSSQDYAAVAAPST